MSPSAWHLESAGGETGEIRRIAVRPLPFLVGRRSDCDLVLESHHGSQRHAEFFRRDGVLWLRDLKSTNGTSVNEDRITGDCRMRDGDIVHFADVMFRLVEEVPTPSLQKTQVFSESERMRLADLVRRPRAFREMLDEDKLRADFQPLVRFSDRSVLGYEILGRGELAGRDTSPGDLFFIAEKLQEEVALSVAFRAKGLELARRLPAKPDRARPRLFINTPPEELADCETLLRSLEDLRHGHPSADLVLEIHEAAATDIPSLQALRKGLKELRIGLAFDDFGTGQARLLELIEVSPQYLKFDVVLVEGLHLASAKRREMVKGLLHLVADMEISSVAECIESAEEAEACAEIGFDLAQGYHFGRPAPPETFS